MELMERPRPSPVPIVVALLVGCWWVPLMMVVAAAFSPWAPPRVTQAAGLSAVALAGFAGARWVRPWFPFVVMVPYAFTCVGVDQSLWSDSQPTDAESSAQLLSWLVPWCAGALAGGWLYARRARKKAAPPGSRPSPEPNR